MVRTRTPFGLAGVIFPPDPSLPSPFSLKGRYGFEPLALPNFFAFRFHFPLDWIADCFDYVGFGGAHSAPVSGDGSGGPLCFPAETSRRTRPRPLLFFFNAPLSSCLNPRTPVSRFITQFTFFWISFTVGKIASFSRFSVEPTGRGCQVIFSLFFFVVAFLFLVPGKRFLMASFLPDGRSGWVGRSLQRSIIRELA